MSGKKKTIIVQIRIRSSVTSYFQLQTCLLWIMVQNPCQGRAGTDNEKFLQHYEPVERLFEFKASSRGTGGQSSGHGSSKLDQKMLRSAMGILIVYPYSKRCCWFTKTYYRYVKGTGPLLAGGDQLCFFWKMAIIPWVTLMEKLSSLTRQCLR